MSHRRPAHLALPNVFLLDLDATVFGDVTPVMHAWELRDMLSKTEPAAVARMPPIDFGPAFATGLLRPGFAKFYDGVRRLLPSAEFFVYTAGSDEWATIIVGQLERYLNRGPLFRRPLLTCEKHCLPGPPNGMYPVVKSLEKVYPDILHALQDTYPAMLSRSKGIPSKMRAHIVFIDDRQGNLPGDGLAVQRRQVVCPAYTALPTIPAYNIIVADTPTALLQRPEVRSFLRTTASSVSKQSSASCSSSDRFFSRALAAVKGAVISNRQMQERKTLSDGTFLPIHKHVSLSDRVLRGMV